MSQNVHTRLPPPGVPSGAMGHPSRASAAASNGSNAMNHSNNSQPASWGHSTSAANQNAAAPTAGLASNQHGASPGTPSAADYVKATTPPSPQGSSSSQGTTLKEHDLLGLSDVSSSNATKQDNSAQRSGFPHEGLNLNLNLGATELRLGPQDDKSRSGLEGTSNALETGSFLVLDAGGKGLEVETSGQDRRSSNVDQSVANFEKQQEEGMDRGFSYSSLDGDRATTQQVGRADIIESSGCRPFIESESLQKWHGAVADRKAAANESLGLNMALLQQQKQNLRPSMQDDVSERKIFDRNYNEEPQDVVAKHHQHAPADEHQVYSEWRERKQHNVVQDDVSSSEKGSAQDQVILEKANPLDLQQGAEQHERMDLEAYPVETRNFPDCKALVALQPPEQQRFQQDMSAVPSPRHADFVVQQKLWQPQMLIRSQMGVPEFQNQQQQQMSLPPKDENSRNGFNGNFSGQRAVFPLANKPGVSGAKRPFDTIGTTPEARNFNDSRVSSVSETSSMMNSSSATSDVEAKSKAQPASYQSWASNRAPTWQMLHSGGGSFGPFPSQTPGRNQVIPGKPAVDAANTGGETASKAWEAQTKSLQQQQQQQQDAAASASQKMSSCPSENKPAPTQAPSSPPEAASAPRASAVGWPPLRSYRKNSIAAHPRPSPVETQQVRPLAPPPPQAASPTSVASQPNSCFVKVYMDGVPFGRKVDLKTNRSYEKLSLVLEDMFRGFVNGQQNPRELTLPSDKRNFLHGSDYVLTYEDQDGDLMLVGDVPWTMFIDTVKRLRIMKGSEAIGLGNRAAEKASKLQPTV